MRQVFISPRLENVEAVERLLEEAGIETRVTERRSWQRGTKRDFSYTDRASRQRWPAVWVVKADEYARARQLLRDQGVPIETTRGDQASFLPQMPVAGTADPVTRRIGRVRVALLVLAVIGAAFVAARIAGLV